MAFRDSERLFYCTKITPDGKYVKTARYRLRKKLGMDQGGPSVALNGIGKIEGLKENSYR